MVTDSMFDNFFNNKKILITGHTGFKGSWLSLLLKELNADVIGYSLEPPTKPSLFEMANIEQLIQSNIGDINDYDSFYSFLNKSKPEIVVHMAAQSLVLSGYKNPLETFRTNVMGTANVIEAVRMYGKVGALLIVTSDKCYENKEDLKKFREDDRLGGDDPYSSSKACAELITGSYQKTFFRDKNGIGLSTVRAGNVIGGGDWADNRLIPDVIRAIIDKEEVIIRNPDSVRPWQHVLDPLHGYLLLVKNLFLHPEKYSGAWNFGPSTEIKRDVAWIVNKIFEIWGIPEKVKIAKIPSSLEAGYLMLDSTKARENLLFSPKYDLDTSIKKTAEWYRSVVIDSKNPRQETLNQILEYTESL